jgi:hypothetical protein
MACMQQMKIKGFWDGTPYLLVFSSRHGVKSEFHPTTYHEGTEVEVQV